jgi:hypothetical protein
VPAFVGGGFITAAMRGKTLSGLVSVADWYPTLCILAGGVDCQEQHSVGVLHEGIPPVDGLNMLPYLTGSAAASPRTEIMLDSTCYTPGSCINGSAGKKSPCDPDHLCIGAIISGRCHLISIPTGILTSLRFPYVFGSWHA